MNVRNPTTNQQTLYAIFFFNFGPTNVVHLFDHLLWSTFQSVVTHNELHHTLQDHCIICIGP